LRLNFILLYFDQIDAIKLITVVAIIIVKDVAHEDLIAMNKHVNTVTTSIPI